MSNKGAMKVFHGSISYLTLLFIALAVDPFVGLRHHGRLGRRHARYAGETEAPRPNRTGVLLSVDCAVTQQGISDRPRGPADLTGRPDRAN